LLKDRLVGTWALISLEVRRSDGTMTHPLGPSPAGRFMFDANGNFSAQSMNPDRLDVDPGGYMGIWGMYEVDDARQVFILTFIGSNQPASIGVRTVRHVNFKDGVAVFSTDPQVIDGLAEQTFITWEKIAPATASAQSSV
jgi:hypothetical protein